MRTRPFLSHRRADHPQVVALKRWLSIYGVGGWRDLDDLLVGQLADDAFEAAINDGTGGLLWYGTRRVLRSHYVNHVELPLAAARKRREPSYPLVPMFASIGPGEAKAALLDVAREPGAVLTEADVDVVLGSNGCARSSRQTTSAFHREVAVRYLRAAVASVSADVYSVALTALSAPRGTQDFTFDWRSLVDERTRQLVPDANRLMTDALAAFRDAIRPHADFPLILLDVDAPLPMAALAGYEWRVTSRVRLTVRQRTGSGILVVEGDGLATEARPAFQAVELRGGRGPCVVAVATTPVALSDPMRRYAEEIGASRSLALHVPGTLDAAGIRGLAQHVACTLREVNAAGHEPHLLLAGPASLAVLIGAASNGAGPVAMPLWNGVGYGSAVRFGGAVPH